MCCACSTINIGLVLQFYFLYSLSVQLKRMKKVPKKCTKRRECMRLYVCAGVFVNCKYTRRGARDYVSGNTIWKKKSEKMLLRCNWIWSFIEFTKYSVCMAIDLHCIVHYIRNVCFCLFVFIYTIQTHLKYVNIIYVHVQLSWLIYLMCFFFIVFL